MTLQYSLQNRTYLVTGGSLGIGRAIVESLAAKGARVIIGARNQADVDAAAAEIEARHPAGHQGWSLDVSDPAAVRAAAQRVQTTVGQIDGLVNCAGVIGPIGKTTEVDLGEFEKTVAINLFGTVSMCQAFYPLLAGQPKKIVNFSGGGATGPFAHYTAYAVSKVAIVRLTENMAAEFGAALDVNCIAPGFVATRMHQETLKVGPQGAGAAYFASTQKQLDEGGVPPEKAAELTAFLLSPLSDGISGKLISAPWDPWSSKEFWDKLRAEKDFATLRRIDDKTFFKH